MSEEFFAAPLASSITNQALVPPSPSKSSRNSLHIPPSSNNKYASGAPGIDSTWIIFCLNLSSQTKSSVEKLLRHFNAQSCNDIGCCTHVLFQRQRKPSSPQSPLSPNQNSNPFTSPKKRLSSRLSEHDVKLQQAASEEESTRFQNVLIEARKLNKKVLSPKQFISAVLQSAKDKVAIDCITSLANQLCLPAGATGVSSTKAIKTENAENIKQEQPAVPSASQRLQKLLDEEKKQKEVQILQQRQLSIQNILSPRKQSIVPTAASRQSVSLGKYCEICRIRYLDLEEHVNSEEHVSFAIDDTNWKEVDDVFEYVRLKRESTLLRQQNLRLLEEIASKLATSKCSPKRRSVLIETLQMLIN